IRTRVEIKVPTRQAGYDIGFRRTEAGYEVVADWYGIRGIEQKDFVRRLQQRYAYHAARARLEEQGFSLVSEESQADGRVHLVLRRLACPAAEGTPHVLMRVPGAATTTAGPKKEPTMELQEIDVFIENDGKVRIEVRGVKGGACLDLTRNL